jgi:hypothetical protein
MTGTERKRRHRERKRLEAEERIRQERGLPPPPAAEDVPEGAYRLSNGRLHPKVGWYRRAAGETFARIPTGILEATYYSVSQRKVVRIPEVHARYKARAAERPPVSAADELAGLDQ